MKNAQPIVVLKASPCGPKCPFAEPVEFSLRPGGCVALSGNSGMGKTTLGTVLSGLPGHGNVLKALDIKIDFLEWDPSIPVVERCGVLFQQTTLLDELTVAGNLAVALKLHKDTFHSNLARNLKIKQLMDAVGLDYERDAGKKPTELSGGMGRRASLVCQSIVTILRLIISFRWLLTHFFLLKYTWYSGAPIGSTQARNSLG
jgi:ABC-type transporter Mla maintaining outer membrane lipid asymmetry ATPase subunit MlaF